MSGDDRGREERNRPDPPDSAPLEDPPGDDELPSPAGDGIPDDARLGGAVDPRLTEAE